MPDFPSTSAVSASDVWAYSKREITRLTGSARTDVLGEDATFEAGSGARKVSVDRLDNVLAYETEVTGSIVMDGNVEVIFQVTSQGIIATDTTLQSDVTSIKNKTLYPLRIP